MSRKCPQCENPISSCPSYGYFVRVSEQKKIKRYRCLKCGFVFSQATFQRCYRQKKRKLNNKILVLLCSGVSQRRISKILKINRKTVARKLRYLAAEKERKNIKNFQRLSLVEKVQFDDLETIEHSKCKPLSITLAVEKETRRILGLEVSQMPAKGHLSKIARKKYGLRKDLRSEGRKRLFSRIKSKISPHALIESDENPHYKEDVLTFFPTATHSAHLGQRGSIVGQGELKKVRFDPLFSLNHTCAMLRANINRLFRKTWCTTKKPECLKDHLELYVYFHNEILLKSKPLIQPC